MKQFAFANRPRIRTSDCASAIDELDGARLLIRYTGPDGDRVLQTTVNAQRFKFEVKSDYPAPPEGAKDAPGQDFMPFLERQIYERHPDRVAPVDPPTLNKEEKRSEVSVSRKARPNTQDAFGFVSELQARWPRHDVEGCLRVALRHVQKQRGPEASVTVGWFEKHWMPKAAEKKITDHGPRTTDQSIPDEPEGWREWLQEHERTHPKLFPALNYRWGEMLPAKVWETIARVVADSANLKSPDNPQSAICSPQFTR